LVLLLIVGLVGCAEPKSSDLVGSWAMAASSRQYLPASLKGISPTLLLRSDGSFTASQLPVKSLESFDVVEARSGSGTWHQIMKDGRQQIQIDFDGSNGTQLEIGGAPGSRTLFYFLSDPDLFQKIELLKR
jgi:hypothetical protein